MANPCIIVKTTGFAAGSKAVLVTEDPAEAVNHIAVVLGAAKVNLVVTVEPVR